MNKKNLTMDKILTKILIGAVLIAAFNVLFVHGDAKPEVTSYDEELKKGTRNFIFIVYIYNFV